MARQRSWTDADLIAAVRDADTLVEVLARLGLSIGGATMTSVRRRMLELGLDDPRLLRNARSAAWAADPSDAVVQASVRGRWTEDELRWAVVASTSLRQVLQTLGYSGSGAAWSAAKAQILRLGLDTSHFGQVRFSEPVKISRSRSRRSWDEAQLAAAVTSAKSVAG
ncbi:MAG TPA: hypothetical protein VM307_13670, partial [Egibacteraceae bacterium]|nr:hypothetical protein [Egibacteraceae bacterium]